METFSRLCFQFISEHRNWLCLSFLETWLLQGSPKVEVLQELERACEVFNSLGFVKSFLSLTQLAALPKPAWKHYQQKLISGALLVQWENWSGHYRQALYAEDASGSSEPYGTLHLGSPTREAGCASFCMSDSRSRPSGCSFLQLPLCFGLDRLQHLVFCQGM